MTIRRTIARRRLAALIAWSLVATIVPLSATAEYGIPAGSGAVITAGQPLAVRVSPGWDAAVSYEIADGSSVTVWGSEQAAPDGSLWYPVDGGFVPADAVTSQATLAGGVALYQEAAPETWVEPAAAGWVNPNTGQWVEAAPALQGWVDPATGQWVEPTPDGWVDPATGEWVSAYQEAAPVAEEWVEPAAEGWVDPATGQWVEAAPVAEGWVDPATGEWVEPGIVDGWVDPATGEWIEAAPAETWTEPAASDGWIDPATGEWVPAAPAQQGWVDPNTGQWVEPAPVADGWVDPATGEWVTAAQQGWVDPATGQWVEPAVAEAVAPVADTWVEPAPATASSTGGVEPWGQPIATAYIAGTNGDGATCRMAPDGSTGELAVLSEGEAVEVRGEALGEWQPVNCAGIGGYVHSAFIAWEPLAADTQGVVELEQKSRHRDGPGHDNGNRGGGAGNSGTASRSGQHIANFAMQYVGYPYAYAGEGPYAFDCSGFTKFVVQNTLGMDITHDMFTQIGMGQSVGMNELQPGDLVFFANTFRPGLSHAGIYVGGGQFVHAENESTGVKVSDINSDYYGSRWAGGTRLA